MANVGSIDRVLRFVLGAVLLAAAFIPGWAVGLGSWRWLAAAAGLVFVLTALFRFCPLYRLVGMSTCPIDRK